MNVSTLKKTMKGKLLVLALPLLLLFGLAAAPSAQARDHHNGRGGGHYRHQYRGGGGRHYYRGGGYHGYRHRHGYWRRYHGRRYWYEGGSYFSGPGGIVITF